MKLDDRVHDQLADLIEKGEAVLAAVSADEYAYGEHVGWTTQAIVCLTNVFDSAHPYTSNFQDQAAGGAFEGHTAAGVSILRAALQDVEQGRLDTLQQLVVAEVFSDFLDQADHLVEQGYVAPAAALAGAVLENGLRVLAERNDITVRPSDDLSALNNKLRDKKVYDKLRSREVSVWIEVRNKAVHKDFIDLAEGTVVDLIRDVRRFLAEHT